MSKSPPGARQGADVAEGAASFATGDQAMQYMLLIHTDETAMREARANAKGGVPEMMGAYRAYTEAMHKAGVFVAGDALQTSDTATVVRVRDGKTQVLDGPYAEAKEQLAGYYLIEAKDLDAALEWAARCPGASWGAIEVRPIMTFAPAPATA
jgi:hypothetical protein